MTDITQISDEMLTQLWLSEQLSFVEYGDEVKRRFAMMSGKSEPQSIGALAEKVVASLADPLVAAYAKAWKDAETVGGVGYIRVNADGTVNLLDPAAVLVVPSQPAMFVRGMMMERYSRDKDRLFYAIYTGDEWIERDSPEGQAIVDEIVARDAR